MDPRGGQSAPARRLTLSERRREADRPWTAIDVAQAVRPHLRLQNTIHWIKSIAIEKSLAGARANLEDDLAVGHYKPINSRRFVHDCHEFVFHFTASGDTPIDRQAIGVRYQDQSNVGRWRTAGSGVRCRGNTWFIPYETIQSREKDRPHPATFPPKLPEMCLRLHGLEPRSSGRRSVPRSWIDRGRLCRTGTELRRHRDGRGLSQSGSRARARGSSPPATRARAR